MCRKLTYTYDGLPTVHICFTVIITAIFGRYKLLKCLFRLNISIIIRCSCPYRSILRIIILITPPRTHIGRITAGSRIIISLYKFTIVYSDHSSRSNNRLIRLCTVICIIVYLKRHTIIYVRTILTVIIIRKLCICIASCTYSLTF